MDVRLEAITDAIQEIYRNLFLLQGNNPYGDAIQDALDALNQFEGEDMHKVRICMEDGQHAR